MLCIASNETPHSLSQTKRQVLTTNSLPITKRNPKLSTRTFTMAPISARSHPVANLFSLLNRLVSHVFYLPYRAADQAAAAAPIKLCRLCTHELLGARDCICIRHTVPLYTPQVSSRKKKKKKKLGLMFLFHTKLPSYWPHCGHSIPELATRRP